MSARKAALGLFGILVVFFLLRYSSQLKENSVAIPPAVDTQIEPPPSATAVIAPEATKPSAEATPMAEAAPTTAVAEKVSLPPVQSRATEIELKQFHELAEKVKIEIPTQGDLQKLTAKQAHYTPDVIQNAALGLGQVAQTIADNERLAPEGLQFYRECAEKETNPNSIRATCLINHENLLKKDPSLGESLASDPKVSERVKNLAKKL